MLRRLLLLIVALQNYWKKQTINNKNNIPILISLKTWIVQYSSSLHDVPKICFWINVLNFSSSGVIETDILIEFVHLSQEMNKSAKLCFANIRSMHLYVWSFEILQRKHFPIVWYRLGNRPLKSLLDMILSISWLTDQQQWMLSVWSLMWRISPPSNLCRSCFRMAGIYRSRWER